MNIKQTIRRINRKYRQFVNYGVTAFIIFALGILFLGYQHHINESAYNRQVSTYEKLENSIFARQDSILLEVDRLKIGMDEASIRRFKITNTAQIIRSVRTEMNEMDALNLATLFYDEAERSGVDLSFVLAAVYTESRFNHKVSSSVGAQGIMQIMPLTFVSIAKLHGYDYLEDDIYDLKKNVRIGTILLHRLMNSYGSYDLAAAGYNGGPKVAANYRKYMNGETSVYVPDETKKYVLMVRKQRLQYKKTLGE